MLYTVIDEQNRKQTYEGFSSIIDTFSLNTKPIDAVYICAALNDAEIAFWWIADKTDAIEELQRYYRSTFGYEVVIKIFKEV